MTTDVISGITVMGVNNHSLVEFEVCYKKKKKNHLLNIYVYIHKDSALSREAYPCSKWI